MSCGLGEARACQLSGAHSETSDRLGSAEFAWCYVCFGYFYARTVSRVTKG